MKYIFLTIAIVLSTQQISNAQGIVGAVSRQLPQGNVVTDIIGSVEYEKDIKFRFQEQSVTRTEYNIAFFANTNSAVTTTDYDEMKPIEFWGHGGEYLSIYGPFSVDLKGDSLENFKNTIMQTYSYFQSNIARRNVRYQHVDIILLEDLIFTCYMDRETPKLAFWYKGNKYPLSENARELLFGGLQSYYR